MRFSEWLERRLKESLSPELSRLRDEEKRLLSSMEGRKDPATGMVVGINKAGYVDAANKLKEVRTRIKELEGSVKGQIRPVPAWIKNNKAV